MLARWASMRPGRFILDFTNDLLCNQAVLDEEDGDDNDMPTGYNWKKN